MAASLLRNKLKETDSKDITVKAIAIEELANLDLMHTLVIGNQNMVQSLQDLYPDLTSFVVEDLLGARAYDQLGV